MRHSPDGVHPQMWSSKLFHVTWRSTIQLRCLGEHRITQSILSQPQGGLLQRTETHRIAQNLEATKYHEDRIRISPQPQSVGAIQHPRKHEVQRTRQLQCKVLSEEAVMSYGWYDRCEETGTSWRKALIDQVSSYLCGTGKDKEM